VKAQCISRFGLTPAASSCLRSLLGRSSAKPIATPCSDISAVPRRLEKVGDWSDELAPPLVPAVLRAFARSLLLMSRS